MFIFIVFDKFVFPNKIFLVESVIVIEHSFSYESPFFARILLGIINSVIPIKDPFFVTFILYFIFVFNFFNKSL